jgi:hypothetical protein
MPVNASLIWVSEFTVGALPGSLRLEKGDCIIAQI